MSGFAGGGKVTCIQQHFEGDITFYIYKANLARETKSLRPLDERNHKIVWDDAFMIAHFPKSVIFEKVLSIAQASTQLNAALIAIEEYALSDDYKKSWASHFVAARDILARPKGEVLDNPLFDDVSRHLSFDANRLLQASSRAWVFGGMGSWNDGFGEGDYQEVTDNLFNTVHKCYVAVCAHSLERAISR